MDRKILSWDEYFINVCNLAAQRSKDPNTQVGAVVVSEDNRILGVGYNGFPRGCGGEDFPWERKGGFLETKYAFICHAEENAIYMAHGDVRGAKVFCNVFPCNECAKTIIQTGIKEVVYSSSTKYFSEECYEASRRMMIAAGVLFRAHKIDSES